MVDKGIKVILTNKSMSNIGKPAEIKIGTLPQTQLHKLLKFSFSLIPPPSFVLFSNYSSAVVVISSISGAPLLTDFKVIVQT